MKYHPAAMRSCALVFTICVTACGAPASKPTEPCKMDAGPRFDASWGVEPYFDAVRLVRAGKSEKVASYTFLRGDRIAQPE